MLTNRQTKHRCPKCGSTDVEETTEVSGCLTCGWTLIGETPCDTCGEPSVGYYRAGRKGQHYCRQHCPGQAAIFREMAKAMVQTDAN